MDIKAVSKLVRFKEIITTLLKYGFDDLVQRLDLPGIELIRKLRASDHELNTYERVRFMLEDLGPTFVKFGQIMSLRPDLLPPPFVHELSKLQDEVTPVEMQRIKPVVEAALKHPLEEVFSIFDARPLAAASLSQVHKGVLRKEGKIVCIKVQRPGIRQKIETDLDILEAIAVRLHDRSEDLRTYDLPNIVRVIRRYLLQEIDFTREARNMRIARSFTEDRKDVSVPDVYEEYCSQQLLVMEYIHGTRLKDLQIRSLAEADTLAKDGLRAAIRQILEDGFFHADPHPGNLLLNEDNRLCLVDWGMVGRLTDRERYEIMDLIKSVVEKDSESLTDALMTIADGDLQIDRRGLERRLMDILDSYFALSLKEMRIGRLLLDITNVLREYRLGVPPDLIIMIKALVTAEGTALQIYPELNVFSEAKSHLRRLGAERFNPRALWKTMGSSFRRFLVFQKRSPILFAQVLEKMSRDELRIHFEHENLAGLRATLDQVSNRLTFGIIIAALIVGSSMLITTGIGPLLFGFPALGIIGYLISGLLGLWVVFNMIRTRKF